MSRFIRDEAIQLKAKFALANLMLLLSITFSILNQAFEFKGGVVFRLIKLIANTAIYSPWSDSTQS
jgi:hypothetical protein